MNIKSYFTITRPANVAIAALSVLVGAAIAAKNFQYSAVKVLLAGLSAGLIAGGGNVINDFFDVEIDKVNKPERPIPAGLITPNGAFFLASLLFLGGILLSAFINPWALAVAVSTAGILFGYSAVLKRTVLWGNLTVAFCGGLAFIYGGLAVGHSRRTLIPAGFAFLFHLGREILKDVEDMKGDQEEKFLTYPLKYGVEGALKLITLVFGLLILATLPPYLFGEYNIIYFWIVLFGVDLFLIGVILSMWQRQDRVHLHRLSNWLKADMVVGLAAVWAGI